MITFTVNIVDSSGKSISVVREYDGELAGRSLSEIESLIFQGKQETMEASELSLLELNQIEHSKKKETLCKNGKTSLVVRTLNGVHHFENQRYVDDIGTSSSYLSSYLSVGLSELICYYSNRISYRELAGLLERMVGKSPYKSRHLQNIVVRESQCVAEYNHQANTGIQLSLNFVSQVDIYDIASKEVVYFDDGVGVKRQKEHRCKEGDSGSKSASTVQTDVVLIKNANNEYEYLTSAESHLCDLTLEDKINITLSKNNDNKYLPLVAMEYKINKVTYF